MKKIILVFLFLFSFQNIVLARVPLDQCFDLYHNTKEEFKEISPAFSEAMLQSGQLQGIRFFGDFASQEHPEYKPHSAFNTQEKLQYNAPQDPISALLQYLFPSPNGQVFAINDRDNDPIGYIKSHFKLNILSEILNCIREFKKDALSNDDFMKKVKDILDSSRQGPDGKLKDKSGSRKKKFIFLRNCFVDILLSSLNFEKTESCANKYPRNIVIHSLFAYALTAADSSQQIYETFKDIFVENPVARNFTEDDYRKIVDQLQQDPKFERGVDVDLVLKGLFGQIYFDQKLPNPLTYVNTFYKHKDKRITYPNCGETSLLNFFYYLWGENGIIQSEYIQNTESKLSQNAHPKTVQNWTKLKKYFLEYSHIQSSASRKAQEEWSHLISNLNRENTDPSLKIVYRQDVCNTQGVGLFNILNVFEKIIPDNILSQPYSDNKNAEASGKFDRLFYLFSRADSLFDWRIGQDKKITNPITTMIVSKNYEGKSENYFEWQFKNGSYGLHPVMETQNDWRQKLEWGNTPLPIKAWMRSIIPSLRSEIIHPSEIYAMNLMIPEKAAKAVDQIMTYKWDHMRSLVPQLVGKTLFVEDKFAQIALYTLLHSDHGIMGGQYYSEFDWKTYISDFKPLEQRKVLQGAANLGSLRVCQHYSIEDNLEAETHLIGAEEGNLPIVQWIVENYSDGFLNLLQEKNAYGFNILDFSLYDDSNPVFSYLFQKLPNPQNYLNHNGETLLHMLAQNPEDMSCFIQKLFDLGMLPNVENKQGGLIPIEIVQRYSHFSNIKILIDQMIKLDMCLDQKTFFGDSLLSLMLERECFQGFFYLLEKGLALDKEDASLLCKAGASGNMEVFQFLVQKGFDVTKSNAFGETPIQSASRNGHFEIVRFLVEKGVDPKILDKDGNTLLHLYFSGQNPNIDTLIENARFLSKCGLDLNQKNNAGLSPFELVFAQSKLSKELVFGLQKLGGQMPDFSKKTDLLLHKACSAKNLVLSEFLVKDLDHPIDGKDSEGNTPLHLAAQASDIKLVRFLLNKGADPFAKNCLGQLPLHKIVMCARFDHRGNAEDDIWDEEDEAMG